MSFNKQSERKLLLNLLLKQEEVARFVGRRMVKNGLIRFNKSLWCSLGLKKFNNLALFVYQSTKGNLYALTSSGDFVFPLKTAEAL